MWVNTAVSSVLQVAVFTLIPWIWWWATARRKESFFAWIGLKKPEVQDGKKWGLSLLALGLLCWGVGELALWLRGPLAAADSPYQGMGAAALPSIVLYAFIQTALSEEILFRGFLLKRMAAHLGFGRANLVQALIFGAVHLLMVWGKTSLLAGAVIVIYPALVAVLLAYLNEKRSGGSILPSWIIHSMLNLVSGLMAAFS